MTGLPLQGMGALITGGAGAIGGACARRLARDGAAVTIMGRTEAKLQENLERVRAESPDGTPSQFVVGDATARDDVVAAVTAAKALTGNLRICVATVGGSAPMAPILMVDEDVMLDELRRNVISSFLAIKHCTPAMVEAGGGSIVCISSDSSKLTFRFMAGYCASKAGLDMLVRVAADELGSLNVRVNAVRPGLTKTDRDNIAKLFADPEMLAEFVRQKPLARTGVPEDIAEGVRYLAGPESAWVTGQSLAIEGGNELRAGPDMEKIVRQRWGDELVDIAMSGRIPDLP